MKSTTGLYINALVLIFSVLTANSSFAAFECVISSPQAEQIQTFIMTQGAYLVRRDQAIALDSIYSCGAFVNDGSVVINPATQVIEIQADDCASLDSSGYKEVFFCQP